MIDTEIEALLDRAGWSGARRQSLAGDASDRRYERIGRASGPTAVLMIWPDETGGDVGRFARIADWLARRGYSAPTVLAQGRGLLLLEDLGDALFARELDSRPESESDLYAAAVDFLTDLALAPPPAFLPRFGPDPARLALPALDWYRRGADGPPSAAASAGFVERLSAACDRLSFRPVTILRDFHAENLFWLTDRTGHAQVGLIDFQDACAGHPVYDLVSLLEDARRDVGAGTDRAMRERFRLAAGLGPEAFGYAAAVVGAQRNLRILGIFARLSLHFGKPGYIDLLPRVWRHLQSNLAHPDLSGLARLVADELPAPTPAVLDRLRTACGTVPTP